MKRIPVKKLTITLLVVVAIAFAAANNITPSYLASAPGVATGIGAKLLCSSRYVSGFSDSQAFDDLVQYSPILDYLSVSYDDEQRSVSTTFFGMAPATASHVDGIGCYVDYPGHEQRSTFSAFPMPVLTSHWPHGTRVETIDSSLQSSLDAMVREDNTAGLNTRALLVVHNGSIVAESYAQGAGPDVPLLGWSMAKSLTAVMLGNLEYRGLLNTAESPVFDAWANDERAAISIEHLLTMTDGLDFSEQYNPGDDATSMLFTEPSASGYAMDRPLRSTPGSQFNYSSGSANLLARLYYERTGGTLASSMDDYRRQIAVPLSFQHAVFEPDASGVLVGSSYLYASARDWARMGQMMLDKGVLNGKRIVSEDWVERSVTPNRSRNNRAYGYQWWLNQGNAELRWPDVPVDAYAAQGNRQQSLTVIPSAETVVVRLGWTSGGYPINDRIARILGWLSE